MPQQLAKISDGIQLFRFAELFRYVSLFRLNPHLKALADQQGVYDHWHYGTNEVEVIEVDDEGNVLKEALETSLEWPD